MSNDGSLKKIKWYGQDNELTYFFIFKLIDSEKIIPLPKRMYEKLCANFCMPDYACDMNNDPDDELGGIDYNSVSLRRNHSKGLNNIDREKILTSIFKALQEE